MVTLGQGETGLDRHRIFGEIFLIVAIFFFSTLRRIFTHNTISCSVSCRKMAEGGGRKDVVEPLMDMLTCSLCLETFTNPRALPCLHTFCLQCLKQFVSTSGNSRTLKCPLCNELHPIPADGVEGFRQDFRIKNLVELQGKKKASPGLPSPDSSLKIEMCNSHPTLEVQFCCNSRECKTALICAKCRVRKHNVWCLDD